MPFTVLLGPDCVLEPTKAAGHKLYNTSPVEAFGRRDIQSVPDFYENHAVLVIEPGRVARGKSEIARFFSHVFSFEGKAEQLQTHVLESGDIALFTSK